MSIIALLKDKYVHYDKHKVYWYTSDDKITLDATTFFTKKFKTCRNSACFNSLRFELKNKLPLYLYAGIEIPQKPVIELTHAEQIAWLQLSKKYNTLPKEVEPKLCVGEDFIHTRINLPEIHNLQQLYVYLTIIRYLREDAPLVKLVLKLVEKGIDYFAAIQIGVEHYVDWPSHSILDRCSSYLTKTAPGMKYTFDKAKSLKYLVVNNYLQKDIKGAYSGNKWNMFDTLDKITDNITTINRKHLATDIFKILDNIELVNTFMNEGVTND